jgi:hypothetical protein
MLICDIDDRNTKYVFATQKNSSCVGAFHTFYCLLASWAIPYFSSLDLAIVGLAHFLGLDLVIVGLAHSLHVPLSTITLSYWVRR